MLHAVRRTTAIRVAALVPVIGVAVVLMVAGGATGAANPKPITLPANLGGYRDIVSVYTPKSTVAARTQRAHQATVNAATVAEYRRAFGGAPVAYHAYADDKLLHFLAAIAIRAPAPGLTDGPVEDYKYLALSAPDHSVQQIGDVRCVVNLTMPQIAPHKPDLSSEVPSLCQRSSRGITVVTQVSGFRGPAGVRQAGAFTDAAWSAASR
jgi:hypothetical protein